MRLTAGTRLALIALSVCVSGCAEQAEREWTPVGAADTSLIFTAPGLGGAATRFMRSDAADYSDTAETGLWAPPGAGIPKAYIMLQKLSPGYVFTGRLDVEGYIEKLQFTADKNPSIGERRSTRIRIGEVVYRPFSFGDFQCVAFEGNIGRDAQDDLARDLTLTDLITGFYCGDRGEKLPPDSALRVVQSIDVKATDSP